VLLHLLQYQVEISNEIVFPEGHNLKRDEIEHPRLLQWQRTDDRKSALIIQEGQKSLMQQKMETRPTVPSERVSFLSQALPLTLAGSCE